MLSLLRSQKTNRKNNHYLAYIVSNIVRRNESFYDKNNNISDSI